MVAPLLGYTAEIFAANGTATYTGGSGFWSDASKWSLNHLPAAGDSVTILPAPGSVTVQLDISATNLTSLTLDATGGNSATLSQSTNQLFINSDEILGLNGTGAIVQNGGTHTIGGILYLGQYAGANGRVNLSNGTLNIVGDEVVASKGNGTFVQSGGSQTIGGALQIALGSGTGSYTLSGGSLTITGTGESIGTAGAGRFDQTGGTHTISNALYVGFISPAANIYSMTNGALLVMGEELIGNFGNGTLNQSGGTHTISNGLSIGAFAGSHGAVNLTGGTLSAADVFVGGNSGGSGGAGTLTVNGGSLNTPGVLKIWNTPGSVTTLSSGTISAGSIDFTGNAAAFQWNGGTLQMTGPSGLLIGAGGTFGPSLSLPPNKSLGVTGTLAIGVGSTFAVNGGSLVAGDVSNSGTFNVVTGNAVLGTLSGPSGITIGGGATGAILTATSFNIPSLTVLNNGGVSLPGNDAHSTSSVGTLSIASSTVLDLGSNYLLVTSSVTPFSKIKQYVDATYNLKGATNPNAPFGAGDYNGRGGITSSVAKVSYANDLVIGVGYYDGALQNPANPDNVGQILGPNSNSGAGTGIPLTQILVRPTLTGDLNGDGVVNAYDVNLFNSFGLFNQPTTLGWQAGDLNGDGVVDAKDVAIFNTAGNFNNGQYGAVTASTKAATSLTGHSASPATAVLNPAPGTLAFKYDPTTGDVQVVYNGFTGFAGKQTFNTTTRALSLIDIAVTSSAGFSLDSTKLTTAATTALSGVTVTGTTGINLTAVNGYLPDGTDLGMILPPNLDPAALANALTLTFNYSGSRQLSGGVAGLIVPEPTMLSLIGLGAMGLLARRRRNKHRGRWN